MFGVPTSVAVLTDAEESTDIIYFARRLVMERLPEARELIPEGYGTPTLGPISTGLGEIYQFEVRGDGYSPMDLCRRRPQDRRGAAARRLGWGGLGPGPHRGDAREAQEGQEEADTPGDGTR